MRHKIDNEWSFTLKGGDSFGQVYKEDQKYCKFTTNSVITTDKEIPIGVKAAIQTVIEHGNWKAQIKIAINENDGKPVPMEKLASRVTKEQVAELVDKYPNHVKLHNGRVHL